MTRAGADPSFDEHVAASESAPTPPEQQGEQSADRAHDHQDHADGVDVEPFSGDLNRKGEDRADRDEEETGADTHDDSPVLGKWYVKRRTVYPSSWAMNHRGSVDGTL